MRNLMILLAVILGISASTQKISAEIVYPKIYINPGHGSWTANDRPMNTIKHGVNNAYGNAKNDTTNFFETNTNLHKGFALLDQLVEYGVPFDRTKNQTNADPSRVGAALDLSQTNIVMSHVKAGAWPAYLDSNGTANPDNTKYNRNLSEIAAEVDTWGADMFISIHSNAATEGGTTNYLYFAWDNIYTTGSEQTMSSTTTEGATLRDLSIEMSKKGWDHRIRDRHTQWTHYDNLVGAGTVKINYQNLGVLNHSVPGYLVEGYFHTYQPARHRYMNSQVCRLEGVDYARGVADYFGWGKESTGDIYGIVRDIKEKYTHEYYTPRDGTPDVYKPLNDVTVTLKQGETVVATTKTDDEWNGAFVFNNIAPGEYTLSFSHEDYQPSENSLTVTVEAAKTTYPTAYLKQLGPQNYPDQLANTQFVLPEEIDVEGTPKTAFAELVNGKTIRRTIVRDDYLYVLAVDDQKLPSVFIFNIKTNSLVRTLGTTAAVGDDYRISDIALTADGVLVGINKCSQVYDGSKNVKAYKWENGTDGLPEGEVSIWWTNNFAGNWTDGIAGESMIYNGTIDDGQFIYTGTTTASSGNARLVIVEITNGEYIEYIRNHQDGTYMTTTYMGTTFNMTLSPNSDSRIIFDSQNVLPYEIQFTNINANTSTIHGHMGNGTVDKASNNASYFKYAGRSLMVAPHINADGKVAGVKLFDITEGLDKATEITVNNATLAEPITAAYTSAHGEVTLTVDQTSGEIKKADIELFLVADGNLTKFTTEVISFGTYAYNLGSEVEDDMATVSFKLNNYSPQVSVILSPVEGEGENIVYEMGKLYAGSHSYQINLTELDNCNYNWSVSVANEKIDPIESIASINTWGAGSTYYRGGVAVDNNPESEYFATTFLSVGRSKGIFMLNPLFQVQSGPYWAGSFDTANASSNFRGALHNGKFYLSDWSDQYPGIWIFDPKNPNTISNIFDGATNDGRGKLTIGGVDVGGGSTGVAFTGEGNNRKMFIYVEDLPTPNGGNKLYRYDIGANDSWGAIAPTQMTTASSVLVNTNTALIGSALHNVIFCSQTRTAGQNAKTVPAFMVITEDDNIIFNGGDLNETLNGCSGGGMALSADESKFAIIDGSATIQIYDVEWTENVPSFTHVTSIPTFDQEICQMSFDYAGNLHCINRKHGYFVHAVPNDARDVVTPAKKADILKGNPTVVAIDEIEEDSDAPVEYFNLQGVKVENPSNGIFIMKQGKKATKVVL